MKTCPRCGADVETHTSKRGDTVTVRYALHQLPEGVEQDHPIHRARGTRTCFGSFARVEEQQ